MTAARDEGFRPVSEVVEALDPEPYLAILEERFGISRDAFDGYLVFRPNSKRLAIVDRELRVPEGLAPVVLGMPFLYVDMRHPRPTTAATVKFGALATRNVVDLDEPEVEAFVHRRELRLRPAEAARCTGPGYVIARHRGMVVGMGLARAGKEGLVLQGMVPRSWPDRWR